MVAETVFSKIVSGEIPVEKVYEDDVCLAFQDIAPVAPVHILLIPRIPLTSLGHASSEHAALLGHLMLKAGELGTRLAPGGFRVVANTGRDGGQTVDHFHLHILGGRPMHWPPG